MSDIVLYYYEKYAFLIKFQTNIQGGRTLYKASALLLFIRRDSIFSSKIFRYSCLHKQRPFPASP